MNTPDTFKTSGRSKKRSFPEIGSSRFGADNKWGNFLSGSGAWRFSDESFMKWTKSFLTDGKLRIR